MSGSRFTRGKSSWSWDASQYGRDDVNLHLPLKGNNKKELDSMESGFFFTFMTYY
jgi:hypothetical protein